MQEHFNENYMESERYPFATFTGFMTDFQDLDFSNKQVVQVKGQMTMHGVNQSINVVVQQVFGCRMKNYIYFQSL